MELALKLARFLIDAIPNIIRAAKSGKDPKDIKLGDVVSDDALEILRETRDDIEDYIKNG